MNLQLQGEFHKYRKKRIAVQWQRLAGDIKWIALSRS